MLKYVKPEVISLRHHPELGEVWVHQRIADDPSILGLGDLVLRDRERRQVAAGRLDLLLQDADSNHRYEVEVQLGATDETHIIRTIEYWDIERKRYPQYDHTAVIIAEDITSRFLNVVALFNGAIPLVAIQMKAVRIGDAVSLMFTTVMSELQRGLVDEDEEIQAVADRPYWEKRAGKKTLAMTDRLLDLVRELDPSITPKYNKFYIGLARDGQPDNFVAFVPKRQWVRVEPRLERSPQLEEELAEAGIDLMDYDARGGRYRFRLAPGDIEKHAEHLRRVLSFAFEGSRSN